MYTPPFDTEPLSYEQSLQILHETLKFGISPMLETVEDMLEELGNPDLCFRAIQIAGTNGKTSTSRFCAALLRAEGLRCALYTSPELVSYTERMEVEGAPITEEEFARGIAYAEAAGRRVNERRVAAGLRPYDITEFDLITVGACVVFAEAEVDVAVLECGMGGRWDATSACKSIETVAVTGVGLDHMHVLGDTVEAIAHEKAAIIKEGRATVLGTGIAEPASVREIFFERCSSENVVPTLLAVSNNAPINSDAKRAQFTVLHEPSYLGDELSISLETPFATYAKLSTRKPIYQAQNMACALALTEAFLGRALDEPAAAEAFLSCPTPGRFDVLRAEPLLLIDACHNPQSVENFLDAVRGIAPAVEERPTLLCAALADKDCMGMVELLAPEFREVYVTQTSSSRALKADELGKLFERAENPPVAVFTDVETALTSLSNKDLIACGSITLAGEVAALVQ